MKYTIKNKPRTLQSRPKKALPKSAFKPKRKPTQREQVAKAIKKIYSSVKGKTFGGLK